MVISFKIFFIVGILCCSFSGQCSSKFSEDLSVFTGRLSKINQDASLVRVRVRFKNMKFINKKDNVEFWVDENPKIRCQASVVAKSAEYLLLRIPSFYLCVQKVGFTVGTHLYFQSDNLKNNLEVAQEMLAILVKKRLALTGRYDRNEQTVKTFSEKVDAVNQRYAVLKQKMELEWEKELSSIEEDKELAVKDLRETQAKLNDVDYKLEKYRIFDKNLELDRWSLDSKRFRKK